MAASKSIAVVEPQMQNLFHSPFNAALLNAIVLGFPTAKVSFSALPGHASAVRSILEEHAPQIVREIEWRTLAPPRGDSIVSRWRSSRRIFRQALLAREQVVFCSISRMQLMQLKRMMTSKDEVLAVLHGDLDRIAEPEPDRFPASVFSLKRVLLTEQQPGLRFVLLGKSIRRNIPVEFEAAFANAVVIDHPYHFPAARVGEDSFQEAPVVFGVFGNSGDGRLLEQIARTVKAIDSSIIFRLIGFVANSEAVARLAPLVEGVGSEPIAREEFVRRARSITYALWLAPAGSFRLRASGTFFDALAYEKPLVYVANAFIDHYLTPAAIFAFRCTDAEEVTRTILQIASQYDLKSYGEAQASIRDYRVRFTSRVLAASLPSKFGS